MNLHLIRLLQAILDGIIAVLERLTREAPQPALGSEIAALKANMAEVKSMVPGASGQPPWSSMKSMVPGGAADDDGSPA